MNARSRVFELTVEGRQVEECALSIFHTLLLHRTLGKFHYKEQGTYSVGTIGYEDAECDFVDLTYVRCASPDLDRCVRRDVTTFADLILNSDSSSSGQISLEFYQKKKTRWLFATESIPWEIWSLKLNLITLNIEQERQKYREKVGEVLAEKMMVITDVMNRHEYVPKMPNQSELDYIFDTSYTEVQPYLFRIAYQSNGPANSSVGTTMRKLIKDTLAL